MPQIVVHRKKVFWRDRIRDYRVMIDGSQAARVRNGGAADIHVEPGCHTVHLAIDRYRSRPMRVEVGPGQTLQLECGPNLKPFMYLYDLRQRHERWVWLRPHAL